MNIFTLTIVLLFVYMTTIFLFALWLEDNSIVDVAYGLAFVLIGWVGLLLLGNGHTRQWLIVVLVTAWGARLAIHLFLKKQGKGEDFRYRQWREEWGDTFVWRSFLQVFMLQGTVIFLIALPVQLVINEPGGSIGSLDRIGILIWLIGFGFEAVGDWRLLRFKKSPGNQGKIIQHGLWRYTRHPNYFGEAVLWWGIFLIALNAGYGMWAVISPVLIGFLLLKVSGIPMLEKKYENDPDFIAYKARTNAFFPWFPRQEG
jgi:steroid 5-alpha reductase family enzyme